MTTIKLKSKTHVFGLLVGIFGALQTFLPTVREFIPPDQYGNLMIGVGLIVIILRNVTTQPIDQR